MTELFQYLAPPWASRGPSPEKLLNSLERERYVATHTTAAERPYTESNDRPPLYPFSPL